jgi:hypothetical protein
MDLKEWIKTYLKSRDVFQKSIECFEDLNGDFIVHKSDSSTFFLIRPELKDAKEATKDGNVSLVTLNTKKNVNTIVSNWNLLSQKQNLCIYFVNLSSNEKWILYPFTHNKITDKSSLKRGLMSLYESISPN